MNKWLFCLFCLISSSLFPVSFRLYNDSSYKLRAVVRGSDGTFLGDVVVLPNRYSVFSTGYSTFGPGGQQQGIIENPNYSLSPYTVHWYCMDGGDFSIVQIVAAGALVSALNGDGPKYCKPPPKQLPNTGEANPHPTQ